MREKARRQPDKKLGFTYFWFMWYWVSAIHWAGKLDSLVSFQLHDRSTGTYRNHISAKEFAHRITILFISAGAFGTGLGQLIAILGR